MDSGRFMLSAWVHMVWLIKNEKKKKNIRNGEQGGPFSPNLALDRIWHLYFCVDQNKEKDHVLLTIMKVLLDVQLKSYINYLLI